MKKEAESGAAVRFTGVLQALKKCFTGADKGRGKTEKIDVGVLADRIRKTEVFRNLPDASIAGMVDHIEMLAIPAGDVVVAAGAEGDFFYMIASGTAHVLRHVEGQDKTRVVAELREGDSFGEEALISNAKRNATVKMKTDGVIMRLSKSDFCDYVRDPLITWLAPAEAYRKLEGGSKWLDVREDVGAGTPRLRGAASIPLSKLRDSLSKIDKNASYVCYCQNGRQSATAAFLLVQRGYNVSVMRGGLQGLERAGLL